MNYRIGDFSQVTRLSVKTLHYYHEIGLLVPSTVEPSGYRWYDEAAVTKARVIRTLKELEFPLDEIRDLVSRATDDHDLIEAVKRRLADVERRLAHDQSIRHQLVTLLNAEQGEPMKTTNETVTWITLPEVRVASLRYRGRYDEIGTSFGRLFRLYGRFATGAPLALYHDGEFKEADADIEACLVLRPETPAVARDGTELRTLPAQKVAQVVHRGPYGEVGTAYQRVFDFLRAEGATTVAPSREVYVKGPGMILPRSPKKFVTLVQVPVS